MFTAMLWILHHLLLLAILGGVAALAIFDTPIAIKYRSALASIVILACVSQWIFDKGVGAEQKQTAKAVAQVVAEKRINSQQAVTVKVVDHYITQIQTIHDKGDTIIKEVTKYVPADSCPLPAGFGVLHDAAAEGVSIPDSANVTDGKTISAQDVAATVAANYTTCHETEAQLASLQEWITQQQAAASK